MYCDATSSCTVLQAALARRAVTKISQFGFFCNSELEKDDLLWVYKSAVVSLLFVCVCKHGIGL